MDVIGIVNDSLSPCFPAPFSLKFLFHFHLPVQGGLHDFSLTTSELTAALLLGFGILLSKEGTQVM